MTPLRFAMFGAGFWSAFQLAGWNELGNVRCTAIYNRTRSKAESLAERFGIASAYDDPEELLQREQVDFVDIVTNAESHCELTTLAARFRKPVVCQKPLATSYADASRMVETCARAGIPLLVNENWRWQAPIRKLSELLKEGRIGHPFRARIRMVSGFPVFDNQPFLKELEQFLLVDIGSHILDVARLWFGEARSIYCETQQIRTDIRGEDVATVVLKMHGGVTVICEMGYAGTPLEQDPFPQTLAFLEGGLGSMELAPGYQIRITTAACTEIVTCPVPHYDWADPKYDLVHASIVPCQADLLAGLRGERTPETTGSDNLRTMRLVFQAYESARTGEVIRL